jgi:hypothetical protein
MISKNLIKLIYFSAIVSLLICCTEKYELTADNHESLLVVEATLVDELGTQSVKLSRTISLNTDEPIYVNNAQVWVEDGNQNTYTFSITEKGEYVSDSDFKTIEGESYVLHITTAEGIKYVSSSEVAPPSSEIQNISAELQTINGQEGVQVLVSNSPGEAVYFKYDYEETYKIVAPFYSSLDFTMENIVGSGTNVEYDIVLQPKEENVRVCYSTDYSTAIIQASLRELGVNSVIDFPVRFIESDNSIIAERYSILVKQYVQSFEAYNFYRILKELGITENLLVENQPGFIQGNITAVENPDESVVGFFQVSSISKSRLYFDYSDFNFLKPPYFYDCNFELDLDYFDRTTLDGDPNDYRYMFTVFSRAEELQDIKYFEGEFHLYTFVTANCGDCSRFSSTVIPEFWEE